MISTISFKRFVLLKAHLFIPNNKKHEEHIC